MRVAGTQELRAQRESDAGCAGAVRAVGLGRPRDPKVDDAILDATRALLEAVGYRRLTVDGVARRAGVSRTTLRLRWRTKAELVFDAVFADAKRLVVPDTGSVEGDIQGCVANSIAVFESGQLGAALQGLVDDCRHEPHVAQAILGRIYGPSLRGFEELVARGVARGEITREVDPDVIFDVIAGSVMYRLTVSRLDLDRLGEQLVELLSAALGGPVRDASQVGKRRLEATVSSTE